MYTTEDIKDLLRQTGELGVVLESGVEYDLHLHDTRFDDESEAVITEGMLEGEYVISRFPAERVEHVRWHRES
jgi:hypothetical protein